MFMRALRILAPALFAIGTISSTCAQTLLLPPPNARLPEFEVATIKPASTIYLGVYLKPGGQVFGGNCSVFYLVMEAFHVPDTRVSGGPDWVKSAKFDITAIPPDDSAARQYTPPGINTPMIDEQRLMMQALLRDRFSLKYHVEKMEQPVYYLRRSSKQLKLNPPKDPKAGAFMSVNRYQGGEGNGELEGINTTMTYTALRLSQVLQRTVLDQTGLSGAYDFHVNAPDERNADIPNATFEGLKTLGLELKAGKAPIDSIIIDEVNKPTPN